MFHAIITYKPRCLSLKSRTRKFDLDFDPTLNENYDRLQDVLRTAYWEGVPDPVKDSFDNADKIDILNLTPLK